MKPPFSQPADSSQCPVEPSHVPYLRSYGRCSLSAATIWGRYFHLLQPSGFCNPVCSILTMSKFSSLGRPKHSGNSRVLGYKSLIGLTTGTQTTLLPKSKSHGIAQHQGLFHLGHRQRGRRWQGGEARMLISSTLLGIKENCLSSKAIAPGRLLLSALPSAPTALLLSLSLRQ